MNLQHMDPPAHPNVDAPPEDGAEEDMVDADNIHLPLIVPLPDVAPANPHPSAFLGNVMPAMPHHRMGIEEDLRDSVIPGHENGHDQAFADTGEVPAFHVDDSPAAQARIAAQIRDYVSYCRVRVSSCKVEEEREASLEAARREEVSRAEQSQVRPAGLHPLNYPLSDFSYEKPAFSRRRFWIDGQGPPPQFLEPAGFIQHSELSFEVRVEYAEVVRLYPEGTSRRRELETFLQNHAEVRTVPLCLTLLDTAPGPLPSRGGRPCYQRSEELYCIHISRKTPVFIT